MPVLAMRFSFLDLPLYADDVFRAVLLGSDETKMIDVAARAITAHMVDMEAARDCTVRHLPDVPVNKDHRAIKG